MTTGETPSPSETAESAERLTEKDTDGDVNDACPRSQQIVSNSGAFRPPRALAVAAVVETSKVALSTSNVSSTASMPTSHASTTLGPERSASSAMADQALSCIAQDTRKHARTRGARTGGREIGTRRVTARKRGAD